MLRQWESADKSIKKSVIKQGVFTKKLTECSSCNIIVENINVTGASDDDLTEKHYSEILDGRREKTLIIGEASAEIDRKIERAIQMMNTHESSVVTITVPLQSDDNRESITVNFEITLTKCERYKSIWHWTPEEKYAVALKYKERGIQLFRSSRFIDAFHKFSRACKILITLEPISDLILFSNPLEGLVLLSEQLKSDIDDLRLALYNNMAGCQLNRKNFEHTIALCTKVLVKDKNNVKALYRRGLAYGSMRDNEKAVADLKAALTLEPDNHMVKEQFHIYNTRLWEETQKCNDMVRRMFKT